MNSLNELKNMKFAVVGHTEWVTFMKVTHLPREGEIIHGVIYAEEPAGGGAVTAVELSKISKKRVDFFTCLGEDSKTQKSVLRLKELGINVHYSKRKKPSRRAISILSKDGERSIIVSGERLEPKGKDNLPWQKLKECDALFVSATDKIGLKYCRECKVLVATPRIGIDTILQSEIKPNALVGSAKDEYENEIINSCNEIPLRIKTLGSRGCEVIPGGYFISKKQVDKIIDSYGCGDKFAAGITAGLGAQWDIERVINFASELGSNNNLQLGPY